MARKTRVCSKVHQYPNGKLRETIREGIRETESWSLRKRNTCTRYILGIPRSISAGTTQRHPKPGCAEQHDRSSASRC